ncbi:MAG: MFS transporter [Burkholderiales bacterium]
MKPIAAALAVAMCNMVAMRSSRVLLSLFALDLGTSVSVIGALVASISLFPLFLSIYAGRLTDRLGVRKPLVWGAAGVTLAMIVPYFMPNLAGLFLSAALLGTSNIFFALAMQHWVGLLADTPVQRTRNFGNYATCVSVGAFIGPMIAGFGIDSVGHAGAYLICATFPLAAFIAVAFFVRDQPPPEKRAEGAPVGNAMDLVRVPELRRILITGGVLLTGIDLFEFYMPVYTRGIGHPASVIGIIVGMYALAAFVVRAAIPKLVRWKTEEQLLTRCLLFGALGFLLVPFLENPWLLGAIAFTLGLCMGCGQPLTMSIIYNRSPAGRSGEALGLRLTSNNLTHTGVPVIFGALGAAIGVAPVFWVIAALLGTGAWYSRFGARK